MAEPSSKAQEAAPTEAAAGDGGEEAARASFAGRLIWVRATSGPAGVFAREPAAQPLASRSYTLPLPTRRSSLRHRLCHPPPPPCEATRLAGQYAVPVAGPDLAGEGRPFVGEELEPEPLFSGSSGTWVDPGLADAGAWWPPLLVILFLILDSSRYILDVAALKDKASSQRHVLAQVLVASQSTVGFVSALLVTLCLQGLSGLRAAFNPTEVLRCLPIAVGFALSQAAIVHAFSQGLGAATAVALGFLYMPLSALISRWMFRRPYGWLETHALVLLTLGILTFSELRSRSIKMPMGSRGTGFLLLSVVLSCVSSLLAEWVLKPKYCPTSLTYFHLQKVRLEVWAVVTSILVLRLMTHERVADSFQGWDSKLSVALACRVLQGWGAGVLAKHLSTVAKAVIQCLSMLIVFFLGDLVFFSVGAGSIQLCLLAVVVALSAFLYQMGRRSTVLELKKAAAAAAGSDERAEAAADERGAAESGADAEAGGGDDAAGAGASPEDDDDDAMAPQRSISDLALGGRSARRRALLGSPGGAAEAEPETAAVDVEADGSPSYVFADVSGLAPQQFEGFPKPHGRRSLRRRLPRPSSAPLPFHREPAEPPAGMVDREWLEQAMVTDAALATWLVSRTGVLAQVLCVSTFIVSDASRTLIYEWSINGTAIVQQSIVVAMSAASIVVGVVLAGFLDGVYGIRAALDTRAALRCLPVAACFSFGQTAQIYAYGVGVSAVENTVIGYFYMPLSAMLSRWIFMRAYTALEWLALLLLTLSASVFVLMQDGGGGDGSDKLTMLGITFVLSSVLLSCLGSILAEKIMKSSNCPFYIQKVHLEVGGLVSAVAMLFVSGVVSSRPNDAFWKERDIGGGHMASGPFVAWDWKILLALVATLFQSWLGGLVAKRLSTVTRAVAQCLSLLLIYFVGDLLLKHLAFDWPTGSMACVVALTVQVFAQAGRRIQRPHSPVASAAASAAALERFRAGLADGAQPPSAGTGGAEAPSCSTVAAAGAGTAGAPARGGSSSNSLPMASSTGGSS